MKKIISEVYQSGLDDKFFPVFAVRGVECSRFRVIHSGAKETIIEVDDDAKLVGDTVIDGVTDEHPMVKAVRETAIARKYPEPEWIEVKQPVNHCKGCLYNG